MTDEDPIARVRAELAEIAEYYQRYEPGDFAFKNTIGRLATAVGVLADEVERLRGGAGDADVMGGGIDGPFFDNDGMPL